MACVLPVVPLFETFEDLEAAPQIIDDFLSHPCARASLTNSRGQPYQVIMLGYSDSNKDTGIIAASGLCNVPRKDYWKSARSMESPLLFSMVVGARLGGGLDQPTVFLRHCPPVLLPVDCALLNRVK